MVAIRVIGGFFMNSTLDEQLKNDEVVLSVQGMSCSACATRIERTLSKLDGVEDVAVSYPLRTAWVRRNLAITDIVSLIDKIEKLGFKAHIHQSTVEDMLIEKRLLQKRLLWACIFTLPLILSMLKHFSPLHPLAELLPNWFFAPWLQLILATIVQFIIGIPFYISAFHAIREKLANMDVLVVIGTTSAYLYSHYEVFRNGLDGLVRYSSYGDAALYFESSAVVITAVLLGKYIELNASLKLQQQHEPFSQLEVEQCTVEREGQLQLLPTHFVKIGELVHVEKGQYIPVDGVVLEGEAYVEEALLTGEQGLISKTAGDRVWAGTFQSQGKLVIKTTATGHQTMLSRIRELVKQGQRSKTNLQRQVDKVIRWFVPAIIVFAFATLFCWIMWGEAGSLFEGVLSCLAVLLVACPCALGLAAPISLAITSSRLVKHGLIVKDAGAIEELSHINTVVFDKTGTLTEGRLHISYVKGLTMTRAQLLSIVAELERHEEHPIAKAIRAAIPVDNRSMLQYEVRDIHSFAGKGVQGYINNEHYLVGNSKLLEQFNIHLPRFIIDEASQRYACGETIIYCVQGNRCIGLIGLCDGVKESAKHSIKQLEQLQVKVYMATGDHLAPAQSIASVVGINHIRSSLLPEQKLELMKELQQEGLSVAMVGDGWNDAPALAGANVGIAMSNSTEAALHAGHMTLLYPQLSSIPIAISMSRMTLRNIKQNLVFALIYNSIMLPIAALGFLQPWMAGIAMALSSVCVVFNALLLHVRFNKAERAGAVHVT